MTRRSGKTLAMVETLPASGSVVVVHSAVMRRYVERMIADVRGRDVALQTRVVAITTRADAYQALTGRNVPVVFDHTFCDLSPLNVAGLAIDLAQRCNVRHQRQTDGERSGSPGEVRDTERQQG